MADTCEESYPEGSDSIWSDNFSFTCKVVTQMKMMKMCKMKNPVHLVPQRKSINLHTVRNQAWLRKSGNSLQKRTNELWTFLTMINWRNWHRGYFQHGRLARSKAIFTQGFLNRHVWGQLKRERFTKHLLTVVFCRKFSTLLSECLDKHNRKAVFSVAWMKMLTNFQAGKATQERSVIERFLEGQSEGQQQFSFEVVHAVKCYSWNGLLHHSQSHSVKKVHLDFRIKEFMLGRGVRWYFVQILWSCPSPSDQA